MSSCGLCDVYNTLWVPEVRFHVVLNAQPNEQRWSLYEAKKGSISA